MSVTTANAGSKFWAVILVVLVIGLSYYLLTMPDQRTTSEKLGDAVHDLDKGPGKAARQLEDRTPGQKIGDAIKDNTPAHQD